MTDVSRKEGFRYGFYLFGYWLVLLAFSATLVVAGGWIVDQQIEATQDIGANEEGALAVAGGFVAFLGVLVFGAGQTGLAYKLVADGARRGRSGVAAGNARPSESEADEEGTFGADEREYRPASERESGERTDGHERPATPETADRPTQADRSANRDGEPAEGRDRDRPPEPRAREPHGPTDTPTGTEPEPPDEPTESRPADEPADVRPAPGIEPESDGPGESAAPEQSRAASADAGPEPAEQDDRRTRDPRDRSEPAASEAPADPEGSAADEEPADVSAADAPSDAATGEASTADAPDDPAADEGETQRESPEHVASESEIAEELGFGEGPDGARGEQPGETGGDPLAEPEPGPDSEPVAAEGTVVEDDPFEDDANDAADGQTDPFVDAGTGADAADADEEESAAWTTGENHEDGDDGTSDERS